MNKPADIRLWDAIERLLEEPGEILPPDLAKRLNDWALGWNWGYAEGFNAGIDAAGKPPKG
jgi:hypothetical protein